MIFSVDVMGLELISFKISIPRFGLFAPGAIPPSAEGVEQWIEGYE